MQPVDASMHPAERKLHPLSWLFVLLQQLRQFLLPLIALFFFRPENNQYWQWSVVGVVAMVLISAAQYLTYRYGITDDSLIVRQGIFERSVRQIPFARIHNVAIHQSLLHLFFGVAEVRLESAGGQKPEAQMRVLGLADALALEALFRKRSREDAVSAIAPDVLLALPIAEVIKLGLLSNRGMIVIAATFGAVWQFFPDNVIQNVLADAGWQFFPDRVIENVLEGVKRALFGYASQLQWGHMATIAAAAAMIVVALLLIRLLSIALALVQFYGFQLTKDGRRITAERGLLTRLRTSVSQRRIQAWTLREGVMHRLLRRRTLQIDTAVVQRGQDAQRALSELAPIATPTVCDALVREILPDALWPMPTWQPLHPHAWRRLSAPGVLFAILLAALLCWQIGLWGLLALLWAPFAFYIARQHADRAGYAVDDRLIAVREGWWSRYWRFAEIDKLQTLQFKQSPLDCCTGMASLWFDTAGASAWSAPLRIRYLPIAEARALHTQMAKVLAQRGLQW